MPKSANVLIVDDNQELAENISEVLATCLGDFSLSCAVARSADEAQNAAKQRDFHLALLDLHLLDGSGLELIEELRSTDGFMQVVFITGDATVESAIRALEKGAFGYVLKPFDTQQLVELSEKAIERALLLEEREGLQAELEQSQQRLRDVIDQVPAFVVALDEDGKIVVWNRQLEAVTGFTTADMLGQSGNGFLGEKDVQRLRLKGGGHRSVRWKRALVARGKGRPPVTYAVGVDVTEELAMQQRARQAARLAAVGTLAAGLAHEVRNPLNSAILQLQLLERRLRRGKLDLDATGATVAAVKGEIGRLDRLVNDFLAFAKPQPLELEPTDLSGLVGDVVELLRLEAERSGMRVNVDVMDGVGLVPVEPQRMRQVLFNLLRNAIEAAPEPGGTLDVRCHPDEHSSNVVLEVQDDGPGFDAEAPIFDAFYTTKDEGTGLGLAIVHRIVSEHGGEISVSSRPGKTLFRLLLPQPASGQVAVSG